MGTFNCLFGYNKRNNGAEFGWDYNCYERATVVISQDNNCVCTLASSQWVEQQTPLHYFPAFCYMKIGQMVSLKQASIELSSEEIRDIGQFLQKGDSTDCVKRKDNLIFILGESFESWCLEMTDETGRCLLPNLKRISQGDNCLYCSKIRCQTRAGNSGDGQMIVNTGLLPLTSSESACMKFANNVFPNFAHFYEHSAIINPWPGIWNQNKITKSYGYTDLIEKNENVNKDEIAFDMAYDYLKQNFGSCCVFVITVSTHTPFNSVENKDVLEFSDDMPKQLKDYLSCFHYTDSCIGSFCDKIENDSLLKNTIIVMTGDHTFFKEPLLKEFQKYSKKNNAPIPEKESFCPLLVLSPSIDKHIEQNEVCYQMDVFPTVLDCIGVDNYYWKGFGVSLLDSVAVSNRTITEDKAFVISNKIIRSNYLKEVEKSF
ncbi:MAG: LTA synthase family protein [Bacteroidaceae bacterium]|nr:LTA synthase family protein [Bacteroidaceae bacterium]